MSVGVQTAARAPLVFVFSGDSVRENARKTFILLFTYLNTFTESRTSLLCQIDDIIIVQLSDNQGLL